MKIKNPDGSTSYNIQDVLNKWKHDFSVMYNYDAEAGDVSHELLNQKARKETEIIQNGYECNTFLNSGLSYDELEKVISKLKNNKAIGCDGIPNEVMCNDDVTITLSDFFQLFLKVVSYQQSGKNVLYHLSQSARKR